MEVVRNTEPSCRWPRRREGEERRGEERGCYFSVELNCLAAAVTFYRLV